MSKTLSPELQAKLAALGKAQKKAAIKIAEIRKHSIEDVNLREENPSEILEGAFIATKGLTWKLSRTKRSYKTTAPVVDENMDPIMVMVNGKMKDHVLVYTRLDNVDKDKFIGDDFLPLGVIPPEEKGGLFTAWID